MCGAAISQILRKASGNKREDCLSILFTATENADNSNALIELTGKYLLNSSTLICGKLPHLTMAFVLILIALYFAHVILGIILAQAVKSTSKSLVVNAEKIWKQILGTISKLDWEDDAVFKLLQITLKSMSSTLNCKDVQYLFGIVFATWASPNNMKTEEQHGINTKLQVITLILIISRQQKIVFEEEACHFVLVSAIEGYKIATENKELDDTYLNSLTELVVTLCQKSTSNKDIHLKLLEAILGCKILALDQKVHVFQAVSKLANFENELLLPVFVRTLSKKYSKALQIPKDEYDRTRIYVMVEALAEFIFSRQVEVRDTEELSQPFIIEFQCDNPNSLHSLPNKLLGILENRLKNTSSALYNDNHIDRLSVKNILCCLTAIRPLHENAELEVSMVLEHYTKCYNNNANTDEENQLEIICLAIQVLSDLSCPGDFFRKVDLNLMKILSDNISRTEVAGILSCIFYQTSLMQCLEKESDDMKVIIFGDHSDPSKCKEMVIRLRKKLVECLSTTSISNRKYYLKSLIHLSSKQDKNHTIFQTMLQAENITPNVGTFRDRVKHLGNIAWSETDEDDPAKEIVELRFSGGLRFLLANLSVNFTPLWDPTIKVIDSYLSSPKYQGDAWDIVYEVFRGANEKIIKIKGGERSVEDKQMLNFRNMIIKSLTYSSDFISFIEKKHQTIVNEFLTIVGPSSNAPISPNINTLEIFIELFKKFTNIKNIKKFNEVKEIVIQHILGHSQATEKSLKNAVEFFLAAYKSLRPHKDILLDLIDSKKWKMRFLALKEETFQHSDGSYILSEIIYQLISAKVKRTAKEKRTAQIANRKFIIRTMFQVGLDIGLSFLSFFRRRELTNMDHVLAGDVTIFEKKLALRKLDITFDVYMMAAKSANCSKNIFSDIIDILLLKGKAVKKEIDDSKREGAPGKRRNKLLDNLIQVFSTLKESKWNEEQERSVLENCLYPLLFAHDELVTANKNKVVDDSNNVAENSHRDVKFHYLSKIPKLFQLWVDNPNYYRWFFLEGKNKEESEKCAVKRNILETWICENILISKAVDPEFRSKVFNVTCNLIVASSESEVSDDNSVQNLLSSDNTVLPVLLRQFENWLTPKTCMKRTRETAPRLRALLVMIKYLENSTHQINAEFFTEKLSLLAVNGTLEVQNQSLHVLNVVLSKLTKSIDESTIIPLCAFKLLTNITNFDNKKLAAKILWKHVQKLDCNERIKDLALDDNFLHGNVQSLTELDAEGKVPILHEQTFLFLFHFAASEIYSQDFSTRAAAVLCLRDVLKNRKKQVLFSNCVKKDDGEEKAEYVKLVDKILLPVISKGMQSLNDRIQAEFMEILLQCIATDEKSDTLYLGSIQDIGHLMPSDDEEQELNFFENMKHIQKHRRGRAMRKLALKLDANKDFISRNCRLSVVYPLIRTYIYNQDYISQPEIVNSAITCITSLASSYNWKDYKNLLMQFLLTKNQSVLVSPPFRKQRVKVLSGVLSSFHFPPEEESAQNLKDIIAKLLKKLNRMGAAGASQDIEDQVDIALFVPILKIMLMFPEDWLKSNLSMLVINLSSKLRSRKIEERREARDVLCQMAKLLGPKHFNLIFSILEGNLQRGYQLHILLFTINAVMNAMTEDLNNQEIEEISIAETNSMVGAFDNSLNKIMRLIGDELFGNLLEEKRVAALVKKTPEASKVTSYGLLEKLGSFASKGNVGRILSSLLASNTTYKYIRSSSSTSSYESLQKLRKAVKSFQTGIVKNRSLEKTDFLLISHGLLSGKLLQAFSSETSNGKSKPLLLEMAFCLLCHNASQLNAKGDSASGQQLEEMKPFKEFVMECINEKDVNVVTGCLKYLTLITQSRSVVDTLLDSNVENNKEDFMCVITKKCRQYQPMNNRQPYNYICQILRNLLTHNSNYQFSNPEQLKSICLFFQMCLETNYDDVNAIKLLGLLLFKFYTEEASSAFLKLLCVCTIKCRDEMTFNMTKPIILKIVKRHKTLTAAMAFYSQHVTYEIVDGK